MKMVRDFMYKSCENPLTEYEMLCYEAACNMLAAHNKVAEAVYLKQLKENE